MDEKEDEDEGEGEGILLSRDGAMDG